MLDGETNRGREGAQQPLERGAPGRKEGKAANSRSAHYGGQEGRMEKLWKSESPSLPPLAMASKWSGGGGAVPLQLAKLPWMRSMSARALAFAPAGKMLAAERKAGAAAKAAVAAVGVSTDGGVASPSPGFGA